MSISLILLLVVTLVRLAIFAFVIYAAVQGVKALRKYNRSGEVRKEKAETRRSLGEVLKEHRVRCKMTQEFVAESLGVSRQAVSKWETGTADPSTSNLLALAKLFGVSAEELLRQVWINLLNNAIRYTPPGGEIGVELKKEGREAAVRVWDTGSGMTPEVQSHIFEKYYQGAAEDKKHGLGLGLSIVHRIIELTEGRIEVDSQPQQGSSFTVYLPLNQKGA